MNFLELLTKKYNEVIRNHGDFKSIIWVGKEKKWIVNLYE